MTNVVAEVKRHIKTIEDHFGVKLPMPAIKTNITSRSLNGQYQHKGVGILRFHPGLIKESADQYFATTVPHEVAHHAVRHMNDYRCKPHGIEWQRVMRALGVPANRCNNYDRGVVCNDMQRDLKPKFEYACGCTTHSIGFIRHRRIAGGQKSFSCRGCRQTLKYTGKVV